jgi:hypothetical protein
MRRIQFDVETHWGSFTQPWKGLLKAGLRKRRIELERCFRYDRCIAIFDNEFKEREVKIMASAALDPRIILTEYVYDAIKGQHRLQRASPYMFSATSEGFARMCEFERTFENDSEEYKDIPDDYRFYQHIHTMGYSALGVL